jgi:predicted transcriptional regulator
MVRLHKYSDLLRLVLASLSAEGGRIQLAFFRSRPYAACMTKKEMAVEAVQDLPDSATWADIADRIRFLAGIDKGLADIKAGSVVPHEEVRESLKKWFSARKA